MATPAQVNNSSASPAVLRLSARSMQILHAMGVPVYRKPAPALPKAPQPEAALVSTSQALDSSARSNVPVRSTPVAMWDDPDRNLTNAPAQVAAGVSSQPSPQVAAGVSSQTSAQVAAGVSSQTSARSARPTAIVPAQARARSSRAEFVVPNAELARFLGSKMLKHLALAVHLPEPIVSANTDPRDTALLFDRPEQALLKIGSLARLRTQWRAKRDAWLALRMWRKQLK